MNSLRQSLRAVRRVDHVARRNVNTIFEEQAAEGKHAAGKTDRNASVTGCSRRFLRYAGTLSFYRNMSLMVAIPACAVITYKVQPLVLGWNAGTLAASKSQCNTLLNDLGAGVRHARAPPPPGVQGVEPLAQARQEVPLGRWQPLPLSQPRVQRKQLRCAVVCALAVLSYVLRCPCCAVS